MNIQKIPINQISVPDFYFRIEDAVLTQKIATCINKHKCLKVITVRKVAENKYEVIEGRRVLEILKANKETEVTANVLKNISDFDAKMINITLNHTASLQSFAKMAFFVKEAVQNTNEKSVSSLLPFSIEEIERLCQITTFDWSQFQKQTAKGQMTFGEEFNIDEAKVEFEPMQVKEKGKKKKEAAKEVKSEGFFEEEKQETVQDEVIAVTPDNTPLEELIASKPVKEKTEEEIRIENMNATYEKIKLCKANIEKYEEEGNAEKLKEEKENLGFLIKQRTLYEKFSDRRAREVMEEEEAKHAKKKDHRESEDKERIKDDEPPTAKDLFA